MEAVRIITGRAVPLDRSDVDTDQIIPSDWLKRVERTGFERGLFSEWRDDRDFAGRGIFERQRLLPIGLHPLSADEAAGGIKEEVEVGLLGHGVGLPPPQPSPQGGGCLPVVLARSRTSLDRHLPLVGEVGRGVATHSMLMTGSPRPGAVLHPHQHPHHQAGARWRPGSAAVRPGSQPGRRQRAPQPRHPGPLRPMSRCPHRGDGALSR